MKNYSWLLDLFGDGPGIDRLMEEIKTDETTKSNIRKDIEKSNSASEQWQILLSHQKGGLIQSFFSRWGTIYDCFLDQLKQKGGDKNFTERIKLSYCYPRIDIKVTEGFNHLLKVHYVPVRTSSGVVFHRTLN